MSLLSYLHHIQRQEVSSNGLVLHYDAEVGDLRPWRWPITEKGERVAPSDFDRYRLAHDFLGPSCLCAADSGYRTAYIEAAIFVPLTGEFTGEYVAACASDSCGYWICMERMYTRNGLFVRKYPLRGGLLAFFWGTTLRFGSEDGDNLAPTPTVHVSRLKPMTAPGDPALHRASVPTATEQPTQTPRLSHFNSMRQPADIDNSILRYQRPEISIRAVQNQILDLDSFVLPGLPEAEFKKLFSKCHCGLIMTKRVFNIHRCMRTAAAAASQSQPVIIDLTIDNSSSDELDH